MILDGMNGLFARLVYVLSVSYDVAWVDEDNDILNDTLKEILCLRIFLKNLIQFIRNLQGKNYKKKKSN